MQFSETGEIVPLWDNIYNPTPFLSVQAEKAEIIGKVRVQYALTLKKKNFLDVIGFVVSFVSNNGRDDSEETKYYELKLIDLKNQQVNILGFFVI